MCSEMSGGSSERLAINNQCQSQAKKEKEKSFLKQSSAGAYLLFLSVSVEYLADLGLERWGAVDSRSGNVAVFFCCACFLISLINEQIYLDDAKLWYNKCYASKI